MIFKFKQEIDKKLDHHHRVGKKYIKKSMGLYLGGTWLKEN
jgi:hypothetical protein